MKNRKAIFLVLIVLAISVFATGCMDKVNEKIGTKIGEKVLEKALGEDVKIDTKGNTMSIGTKDGGFQVGEDLDWPADKMSPLPKPKGNVVSITEIAENKTTSVIISFKDKDGPRDYLKKIKDLGYVESSVTESEGYFLYTGFKDDNTQVMFQAEHSEQNGILTLTKDSENAKAFFEKENEPDVELDLTGVDMTDEVPWPKDQMDKIPELEGKITNVTTSKEYVYVEFDYVKKDDMLAYIKDIKSMGFDKDSIEMSQKDSIFYAATNGKDYGISINWQGKVASVNYTKP